MASPPQAAKLSHSPPIAPSASSFTPSNAYLCIQQELSTNNNGANALPSPTAISTALSRLPAALPQSGLGDAAAFAHLIADVSPGLNGPKTSAYYYGFVTGGVLPVAEAADCLVTAWDQNVQVHLPGESVSTVVEERAARFLVQLLELDGAGGRDGGKERWQGKTFTTGATASNVLGLACGRESVLQQRLLARGSVITADGDGVGELGVLEACRLAKVTGFQVLTTMGHSSLYKASSILGIGRRSVRDVGDRAQPWKFDLQKLETELAKEDLVSIVAISCGEVNTGRFATSNGEEMRKIRELCDRYGAWLHVDGGNDLGFQGWSWLMISSLWPFR
jgi:glutamate/tyrosine decarboxylase-like PLP-dependent enzyme